MFNALIMAGGSGTRLWPLSRDLQPKQSLNLIDQKSLFQHAVDRLQPLFSAGDIWVIARDEHTRLLSSQVQEIAHNHFLIEPEGRGTAPAIGLAAIHFSRRDPESIMAVLTADHYIKNVRVFQNALTVAGQLAQQGYLVTLGITPTAASTAFGYIEQGQMIDTIDGYKVFHVSKFVEKPNRETANRMVSSGLFSWNSGMFIWQVKRVLQEFQKQMPDFYAQLMEIDDALGSGHYSEVLKRVWPGVSKQTIDYGVMEHADRVAVIPIEIGWTDVGSWSSLYSLLPADELGNVIRGDSECVDTQNCLILGDRRLIATIGIKDLVIVDTGDALLVSTKSQEQLVREIVARLKEHGRTDLI